MRVPATASRDSAPVLVLQGHDGIGIAAMMALAEDESLPHGPLELLMTVNEEVGGPGEGASRLDPSLILRRARKKWAEVAPRYLCWDQGTHA